MSLGDGNGEELTGKPSVLRPRVFETLHRAIAFAARRDLKMQWESSTENFVEITRREKRKGHELQNIKYIYNYIIIRHFVTFIVIHFLLPTGLRGSDYYLIL